MASYKIEATVDGNNIKSLEKKLKTSFPGETFLVKKIEIASSRADRLSEAQTAVEDATGTVESLKDELQEWKDNLPENFQNGSKADELDDAINELDSLYESLSGIDFGNVSFPGMF